VGSITPYTNGCASLISFIVGKGIVGKGEVAIACIVMRPLCASPKAALQKMRDYCGFAAGKKGLARREAGKPWQNLFRKDVVIPVVGFLSL
jgi:hypothetical protein